MSITCSQAMMSLYVFLMKVYKEVPLVKYELSSNFSLCFSTERGIKLDQFLNPFFPFELTFLISSTSSYLTRSSSG